MHRTAVPPAPVSLLRAPSAPHERPTAANATAIPIHPGTRPRGPREGGGRDAVGRGLRCRTTRVLRPKGPGSPHRLASTWPWPPQRALHPLPSEPRPTAWRAGGCLAPELHASDRGAAPTRGAHPGLSPRVRTWKPVAQRWSQGRQ